MIDTDKYEGHTPAPWKWIIDDKDTYLSCFDNDVEADENLIADAPLLLVEVLRLQAWKKLVSDIVQQQDGSHLREMLKELIE